MSQKINIRELVDEISQPNVVCVIDNEIPVAPEESHLHIIYSLVNIVKQCISKKLYNPYIHIKDVHGTLFFNNRLHIEQANISEKAVNNPGYCNIHLIKNENSLTVYYCATTPKSLTNDNQFYLNQINFSNGTLNEKAYEIAAVAIVKMVKEGEHIDHKTPIDTSLTVHNYEQETKQWRIECHWRKEL